MADKYKTSPKPDFDLDIPADVKLWLREPIAPILLS
jgi:hypothetical protein